MISGAKPRKPRIKYVGKELSMSEIIQLLFQAWEEKQLNSFLAPDDENELGEERIVLLREVEKQGKKSEEDKIRISSQRS